MPLSDDLVRFVRHSGDTPVLSAYVHSAFHDPAAKHAWRTELRRVLRVARTRCADDEEREEYDACAARLMTALPSESVLHRLPGWFGAVGCDGEIVATVSSRSVGPGTRKNIDEFTRTTAGAVEKVGGAAKGKAIIIINPAEPPLMMRDTVHCLTETTPDQEKITASIHQMLAEVQKYVPGYRLVNGPVFDGNRVSVFLEVEGLGDYLPKYAGNLDIMTAAAARTAEMFAEEIIAGRLTLQKSAEPAVA